MFKKLLIALASLFLAPLHAEAAPLVGLVTAAFSAIGSTALGAAAISAGLSYGLNWLYQKFFGESNVQGVRQRLETGGDKPLSFLWGTTATSGKLVYFNQHGHDNGIENIWLTLVIAVSDLPIQGSSNYVWVNGERCTFDLNETDSDGFHPVKEYDKWGYKYLWGKFYDGTQTDADHYLKSKYGNDNTRPFKNDMIGRGVAYYIMKCHFSSKGLWSGVPTFLFPAKGIKLYDLRKDSTAGGNGPQRWNDQSTWTWSDNIVVAKYNFIRGVSYGGKWIWGGQKVNEWRLPPDNWIAAMNVCDQQVDKKNGPGVIKVARYAGGGEISVDTPALSVVNELDKCSSGHTTEIGGIFKTWAGPPGLSVFSFTDNDVIITEAQEDSLFKPLQETFNAANATYTEPDKGWAPKEAPARVWDNFVTQDDSQVLVADLSFPFVSEKNQVQRLMREVIHDSRRQATHLLQLPPEAWLLEPYDVVTWNSARNGYINKKFIVASIDDLPNCNQLVLLREVDPGDYDWDVVFELDSEVGPMIPVKPGPLDKPFTVEPSSVADDDGDRRPSITLLWDWADPDMDVEAINFQVRRTSTGKIVKRGRTNDPTDGSHDIIGHGILPHKNYEVRAKAIPISPGRESVWSVWMPVHTHNSRYTKADIGDGAVGDEQTDATQPGIPTAVTLVQRTNLDGDGKVDLKVKVTWTAPAGATAKTSYEVFVSDGTDDFRKKSDDRVVRFGVRSGQTYTVKVRAISFNGTKGAWSDPATVLTSKKLTAPTAASGLTVSSNHRRNRLKWTPCPDSDYKHTNIYRNSTNNFPNGAPFDKVHGSVFIDDDLEPGVTWHYWVAHQDKSGNEGAKAAVANGAAKKIAEIDTDDTAPGTPTAVTLVQRTNLDDDGKVDLKVKATWSAPTGSSSKISYEVFVSDGTDDFRIKSDDRVVRFGVRSGQTYTVKVRAIAFNGTKGPWSTAVPILTSKKATAPTAASGLTVASNHRRNRLKWTPCPDSDYKHTNIYRNASNTFPGGAPFDKIHGSVFVDDDLEPGVTWHYWVAHQDKSGNEGAKDAVANGVAKKIADADIADLSGAKLINGTVVEAALAVGRSSNLLLNTDARLGKEFFAKSYDPNSDHVFSIRDDGFWNPRGHPSFELYQPNASVTSKADIHVVDVSGATDMEFPVLPGQRYEASAYFGSHRCTGEIIIFFKKANGSDASGTFWNSSGPSDYSKTGGTSLAGYQRIGVFATAPADAASAAIIIRKNATLAGFGYTNSYLFFTRMFFAEAAPNQTEFSPWVNAGGSYVNSNMILAGAVDKAKFASGLSVPEVVAALPSTGNFAGRMVFLTTDNKLYRHTGGAWVATVAAVDVTGTMSDAQLSTIAATKVTGQLTNTQIASLAASKLTGQITNTQITDNAISTPKLQAGAVTANEIAAGAITTSKLAVGSGANMIKNSDMRAGLTGWGVENSTNVNLFIVDFRNDTYAPEPGTLEIYQVDGTQSVFYGICPYANGAYEKYAVAPGKFYELSFYYLGHRCSYVAGHIQWIDAAGVHISYSGTGGLAGAQNTNPGKNLANYQRGWGIFQAPANAVSCRPFIRHGGTQSGSSDSYLFLTHVYLGEANANQTEKTPWSPAGTTLIENGNIATNAITADKIAANTITAAQIAANTITASKIATGTITATQIAANSITAAEIASNAITANELAANSVIAGKIQAGAIGVSEIAANAITAKHLLIADNENLIPDANFEQSAFADVWDLSAATPTYFWLWTGDSQTGGKSLVIDNLIAGGTNGGSIPTLYMTTKSYIPVTAGESLAWEIARRTSNGSSSIGFYYRIYWYDRSGVPLNPAYSDVVNNAAIPSAWTLSSGIVAVPATAAFCKVRIYHTTSSTTRYLILDRISLRKAKGAELIVDGSITANKLTVTNLAAISAALGNVDISQANIGTLSVGTINIAGNAITTEKILTGAVTDQATSGTGGGTTVSGGSTIIQKVTSNHGAGAEAVLLIGQFKNNSNNTISATLSFTGDNQGTLYETGTINIGPKQLINVAYMYKNPSGTSSNFNFKVLDPNTSFSATDRRLVAIGNKK